MKWQRMLDVVKYLHTHRIPLSAAPKSRCVVAVDKMLFPQGHPNRQKPPTDEYATARQLVRTLMAVASTMELSGLPQPSRVGGFRGRLLLFWMNVII